MGRQKVTVTDLEKAIINQIRRHMDERSWSENRLSIEANMVSSTVHRMLSGKQNLTLSYLEQVCSAFGMRVSEIVRNSEQTIIGTAALGETVLSAPSAPSRVSAPPVASLDERRKVSEGLPIFDPVARGLPAKRDERDDDTEQ